MGEPFNSILSQGGLGILAAILLWLFLQERKDHKADQKADRAEISALTEARRIDNKETTKEVIEVLQGNSQSLRILSEKIEVGKAQGRQT